MRTILSRLRALFTRNHAERDLNDEVRAHLDLLAAEYERKGLTQDQARLAARRAFGGVEQMKERYRDGRSLRWLEDLWRDVRYAVRMLRRDRGLASVAVITLALGIGANTALFSVIDALMFKRLPVQKPDELTVLAIAREGRNPGSSFSYPYYEDLVKRADAFSGVLAFGNVNQTRVIVGGDADAVASEASSGSQAEIARSQSVSGNFFSVLGVRATVGRTLVADDDGADVSIAAAVLSDGFWARRFGRDPRVVGRRMTVNEVTFTIVGVAAAGFRGVQVGAEPDIWWSSQKLPQVSAGPPGMLTERNMQSWRIIGRLRASATGNARAQAQAESLFQTDLIERVRRRDAGAGPRMTSADRRAFVGQRVQLESGAAGWTELRSQFQRPLLVLMIVVGLVLLVACANVANLLLARATARRKEIAVRMALGSGRRRLVRQLLTESLLLAGAGGVMGVGVSLLGSRLVTSFMEGQDVSLNLSPDGRVLAFTAVVSLGSALLFGLMPSLTATRADLALRLNDAGRGTHGGGALTIHNAILASQVALSVIVLIAAGLFVRTLINLQRLDTGVAPENLAIFSLSVPGSYEPARRVALYQRLLERLEGTPGTRAAYSVFGLLSGNGFTAPVAIPGYSPGPDEDVTARGLIVGLGFFEVMGARLVLGRPFAPADERSPVRVAVVSQSMGRRFFGANPLGRRFTMPGMFPGESFEVVGVAADSKYRSLREPAGEGATAVYLPAFQTPGASMMLRMRDVQVELRTPAGTTGVESMIRRTMREIDPTVSVTEVRTMSAIIDRTIAQDRMLARLALWFGVLALVLGAIGIYGVRSYSVSRRTSEIGLRIALGATSSQVLRHVVGQGLTVALSGIAIGLAAAAGLTRFVEGLLFRVTALDPQTFIVVAVLFASVAVASSYVPARRAARVDPAVALRSE